MGSLLLPVIYLAFVSLGLPDSLLGAAWPVMYGDLAAPVAAQSAVSMLISAMTVLSSLATDKLSRRLGTGRLVACSVGLTAAAILSFSACSSLWQLLIASIPYGLGAGAIDAALNNYVAINYGARHMSWLHCCWGVGTSIGPIVMGWALGGALGWRGGYLAIGGVQAAITAAMVFSIPLWSETGTDKDGVALDDGSLQSEETKEGRQPRSIFHLLRLPGARATIGAFGCYSALESSFGLWAASLLVLAHGIGEPEAAAIVSLFYLGITTGRLLSGLVAPKVAGPAQIRIGQALIGLGIAVLLIAGDCQAPLGCGIALVGLGCAPIYPSIIALTPARFGTRGSQGMVSLQMACAYVGSTFFPPVCALIVGAGGAAVLPWLYAALTIAMFSLSEVANRRCVPAQGTR